MSRTDVLTRAASPSPAAPPARDTHVTSTAAPRRRDDALRILLMAGYVFFLPVQIAGGGSLRLAVSDLFVVAYLVVTGFGLRRMAGAWSIWFPALLMVLGMGMLVALVSTGSLTQYAILQKAVGMVILMLSMACLVDCMTTVTRIRLILQVFLAGVVLNVLGSLAVFAVQQGNPSAFPQVNYVGTRLSGLLVDPNAFGGLIACALMLHLFTGGTRVALVGPRTRWLVTAVLAIGLVLTFSRSAWIAAVLGIVVAVLVAGGRAVRSVAPLVIATLVAVPVLAAVYIPDLGSLARRPSQIGARVDLIDQAMHSFTQSPLWGIGLGVFGPRYGEIVHNSTIWFLAEMGLIGLVVFIGFVASFALRMLRLLRETIGDVQTLALAALSAHAAMFGLSVGIEALYQRYWWLVLAVGGALLILPRAERR